jgi:hypothetical protein
MQVVSDSFRAVFTVSNDPIVTRITNFAETRV